MPPSPVLTLHTSRSRSFCWDLREQREVPGQEACDRAEENPEGTPTAPGIPEMVLWGPWLLKAGHKDADLERDPECQAIGMEGQPSRALWSVVLCSCPQRSS